MKTRMSFKVLGFLFLMAFHNQSGASVLDSYCVSEEDCVVIQAFREGYTQVTVSQRWQGVLEDCENKIHAEFQIHGENGFSRVYYGKTEPKLKRCLLNQLRSQKGWIETRFGDEPWWGDFFIFSPHPLVRKKIKAHLKCIHNPLTQRTLDLSSLGKESPTVWLLVGAATPGQLKTLLNAAQDLKKSLNTQGETVQIIPRASTMDLAVALAHPSTRGIVWFSHGGFDTATGRGLLLDADRSFIPREVFNLSALGRGSFFYALSCNGSDILKSAFSKDSDVDVYGTPGLRSSSTKSVELFVSKVKKRISQLPLRSKRTFSADEKQAKIHVSYRHLTTPGQYFVFLNRRLVGELKAQRHEESDQQEFLVPMSWLEAKNILKVRPVFLDQGLGLSFDSLDDFEVVDVKVFASTGKKIFEDSAIYHIGNESIRPYDLDYARGSCLDLAFEEGVETPSLSHPLPALYLRWAAN